MRGIGRRLKRADGMPGVELDLGCYELRRRGRRVKLEKKPMELLIFLVGRPGRLVSREEIVKKLWHSDSLIDTERNVNNIVRKLRTALGDDSAKPRFLETVVGKGYRFIGPVRVIGAQHGVTDTAVEASAVKTEPVPQSPRYGRDPLAYSEFMRGHNLSAAADPVLVEEATQRLSNAVARDPDFALAHATLSYVCARQHFEFDPANVWLEKAEFHCRRALEIDPHLPDGHVANAYLLWGPSKNFQHLEAIAELKRALALEKNLPHAYNRLGTILAHIGLLDHARAMYEKGRPFHPRRAVSPSIVQVYIWSQEYESAREGIRDWQKEDPGNKYAIHFAPQPAMMTGNWKEAESLLDEALRLLPGEPLVISMQGVFYALTGRDERALDCVSRACAIPKSFGHAHHTYYQIACIHALAGRRETAFEWLDRSVGTGFACWPFFLKDHCLETLRGMPEFELLVSSLAARYPDRLGVL